MPFASVSYTHPWTALTRTEYGSTQPDNDGKNERADGLQKNYFFSF